MMLSTSKVEKTIAYSDSDVRSVRVESLRFVPTGAELIAGSEQAALFEFVVNESLVTSAQEIWTLIGTTEREMANGGTEIRLSFGARRGPAEGLEVDLYQQIFPESSLIREKLAIRNPSGRQLLLNRRNGENHFKFPKYSLKADALVGSEEVRIATWAGEWLDHDPEATIDERKFGASSGDLNLAHCHMFHPEVIEYGRDALREGIRPKGPIAFLDLGKTGWMVAYEHASQDNADGFFHQEANVGQGGFDGMQGVAGRFDFTIEDEDFQFLGIAQTLEGSRIDVGIEAMRGAYLEGEAITPERPYESVWTACAPVDSDDPDAPQKTLNAYLLDEICEFPASREPVFYYNTWGMQREVSRGRPELLRASLTYERIFADIERAHQMGVELFVLDDGWEAAQGVWTAHPERLSEGLAPIREALEERGMTLGVWLSPMGIDASAERFENYKDWVVLDSRGEPIRAQWNHPAFDFVSGFKDVFVEDCKRLVDQGVRFFKWDAINTFFSSNPGLHHGDERYSAAERRARYEYLLPIYVANAMEELVRYEPELVIEVDLTEARRVMTGLAPLSMGKLFWMNNGASFYNDYSTYRTKSMRTIPAKYNGIIPLELFTYAVYPQNQGPYFAQRYNVNTSLISGHGFWGNLDLMTDEERLRVGDTVAKSKRVLDYLVDADTDLLGSIGTSPEIYTQIDGDSGAGQVIAFSGSAMAYPHTTDIDERKSLGVLNHSFSIENGRLLLPFRFMHADSSREAFVLPRREGALRMASSTCWIDDIRESKTGVEYRTGGKGRQIIVSVDGSPISGVSADRPIDWERMEIDGGPAVVIDCSVAGTTVVVGH